MAIKALNLLAYTKIEKQYVSTYTSSIDKDGKPALISVKQKTEQKA